MGVGAYFSARIYQNAIAISFDFDFELSWLGEGWRFFGDEGGAF